MVTDAPKGKLLKRKLLRDMAANWKAFAAMLILCTLSVTLLLGINAAARGMDLGLARLFDESNLAQLVVSGEISDQTAREIANLPGVSDAQRRVRLRAKADFPAIPSWTCTCLTATGASPGRWCSPAARPQPRSAARA
jgi:hypothetical protein